ncbi:MAG: hypothetical protein IPN76_04145 [Saprospiraceae bacterium]|nr:hypothetical protein [Saprospiraceae bacterium]
MLRDYNKAEKWYARALKPTKKEQKVSEYAEKRFEYARSLKMMEKYDEAIIEFNKYPKRPLTPFGGTDRFGKNRL